MCGTFYCNCAFFGGGSVQRFHWILQWFHDPKLKYYCRLKKDPDNFGIALSFLFLNDSSLKKKESILSENVTVTRVNGQLLGSFKLKKSPPESVSSGYVLLL